MWKRARELARAAPVYFWAWWEHTALPPLDARPTGPLPALLPPLAPAPSTSDDAPEPKRQRRVVGSVSAPPELPPPPSLQRLPMIPSLWALPRLLERGTRAAARKGRRRQVFDARQGAVDQCLDGTHEAHDLVLVDSAFQTQRALLLLHEGVVSEIRSMVDEASVPARAAGLRLCTIRAPASSCSHPSGGDSALVRHHLLQSEDCNFHLHVARPRSTRTERPERRSHTTGCRLGAGHSASI